MRLQRCTLVNDILRMDEKSLVQKLKVIKNLRECFTGAMKVCSF